MSAFNYSLLSVDICFPYSTGIVASVGLSNLQLVDMNSSRNYVVFGFSLFIGLSLPDYVNGNPEVINTGMHIDGHIPLKKK